LGQNQQEANTVDTTGSICSSS